MSLAPVFARRALLSMLLALPLAANAATTFTQRSIGKALLPYESDMPLLTRAFGGECTVAIPSRSALAGSPVSAVDKVADKRSTRKRGEAGLKCLRSDEGQEVDAVFGGWKKAQADHFNDGALYDQVIARAKKQ
jgi:sulfate transport system substrate-binding protein